MLYLLLPVLIEEIDFRSFATAASPGNTFVIVPSDSLNDQTLVIILLS